MFSLHGFNYILAVIVFSAAGICLCIISKVIVIFSHVSTSAPLRACTGYTCTPIESWQVRGSRFTSTDNYQTYRNLSWGSEYFRNVQLKRVFQIFRSTLQVKETHSRFRNLCIFTVILFKFLWFMMKTLLNKNLTRIWTDFKANITLLFRICTREKWSIKISRTVQPFGWDFSNY